jgi:hypothetical protein
MASVPALKGKVFRVTRVDECGEPVETGTAAGYGVAEGFISVTIGSEYEDGESFRERDADGRFYVNQEDEPDFLNHVVSIEMAGIDGEMATLLTRARAELDAAGDVVGYRTYEGKVQTPFALEVWTGVAGDPCDETGDQLYGYILLPLLTGGKVGELTVQNGVINLTIEDAKTRGFSRWGVGPYNVVAGAADAPSPLAVAIAADEHKLLRWTTIAPPAPTDGLQPAL